MFGEKGESLCHKRQFLKQMMESMWICLDSPRGNHKKYALMLAVDRHHHTMARTMHTTVHIF